MELTKTGVEAFFRGGLKIRSAACDVRGHCRTQVFEFPNVAVAPETVVPPGVLVERPDARATVVSDLEGYFRKDTPFRHYGACCSLRWRIREALSKRADQDFSSGRRPLFVVVEQEQEFETPLQDGICIVVDQKMVTGGRAGETALVVWPKNDDQVPEDQGLATTVLAAVKIVQNETASIPEVAATSCFYDATGHAVYPLILTMSDAAGYIVSPPLTTEDVEDRTACVRTLVQALEAGGSRIRDLVEALRLEKIDTDYYRRTWYLCLFQATSAAFSGKRKHAFHTRHRGDRKGLAHPKPSTTMDMNVFVKLQCDVLAELRSFFLDEPCGGGTEAGRPRRSRNL
ncbi:MAG: hypothetical protein OXG74_19155 [Acidobacteria bacterium]|nr:hypothetical protein [Acidobacteriota bacterium]